MYRICLFVLLLLTTLSPYAQSAIGEWKAMMAYDKSSTSVFFNNKVYAVTQGSLYSYSPEDEELLTYDLTNTLSDVTITHLALCQAQKQLVIIYDNGNIDLMDTQEEVYNITDLKNSNQNDKTVSNITIKGEYAYMSTTFGIVVLNVAKREITATYNLSGLVNTSLVYGKEIFASVNEAGLYKGDMNNNLLDVANWKKVSAENFTFLLEFNEMFYGYIPGKGIYTLNPTNGESKQMLEGTFSYLDIAGEALWALRKDKTLYRISSPTTYEKVALQENLEIKHISYGKNTYWISSTTEKLTGYKLSDGKFEMIVSPISPNAPKHNLFYQMFMHKGKLYTCGGGLFLIPYYNPGCIQVLNENGQWNIYQDEDVAKLAGTRGYKDIASIAVDPNDENHLFAASSEYGVYEFQDGKYVALYTPENSTVQPDYRYSNVIFPNGVKFDADGNLWILCAGATNAISIYTKDKRWLSLHHDEFNQKETIRGTFFDSRGWMWAYTPHHVYNGIFMLNWKGTLEDTSDDQCLFMDEFSDQDGNSLDSPIYCAIEDLNGNIWLGTGDGPWVINNPETLMREGKNHITVTRIKVPRNDGTNYADFLLEGVSISCLATDGGNRKWIGTEKNGVYLISADGLEEIQHFTTNNSPLPSNEIQSIAVDNMSGLVYLGTGKGLVTYQSDATEAYSSFSESNVRVFPNPVRPDYAGYITINGLMMNSDVKITDTAGNLIHEGRSTGGSYSWNGLNKRGHRLPSGIYHVLAADEKGKEGIVARIVMIR